jgi:hypothetical protein
MQYFSWAVVAQTFNPSTWEAEAGGFLSLRPALSLVYRVISRTAKAIQRNPVSKNQKKKKSISELSIFLKKKKKRLLYSFAQVYNFISYKVFVLYKKKMRYHECRNCAAKERQDFHPMHI